MAAPVTSPPRGAERTPALSAGSSSALPVPPRSPPVRRSPLHWQLALLVVLATLPIFVLLGYAVSSHRQMARQKALQELDVATRHLDRELRVVVSSADHLLQTLGEHPLVRAPGSPATDRLLAGLLASGPEFASLIAADPSGRVFACAPELTAPLDVSDRRWFREALARRTLAAGEVVVTRLAKRPGLHLGRPVVSGGQITAILGVSIDADRLLDLLLTDLPPEAEATITDHRGVVLLRSGHPESTNQSDDPAIHALVSAAATGRQERQGSLLAWCSIRFADQGPADLVLRLVLPVEAARGPDPLPILVWTAGFTVLLAGIAWWLVRRSLSRPLTEAIAALDALAASGSVTALPSAARLGPFGPSLLALDDVLRLHASEQADTCARLEQDRQRLRLLADGDPDLVTVCESDGRIVLASGASLALLGVPASALAGQSLWNQMGPEDGERLQRETLRRLMAGELVEEQVKMRDRDGAWIELDGRLRLHRAGPADGAGEARALLVGSWRSRSARVVVDPQRCARAWFQGILDGLPTMAWLKDREGRYLVANAAYAQAAGTTCDGIAGRTDEEIWPRDLADRHRADDAQVMVSRGRQRVEAPFPLAGRTVWMEITKLAVVGPDGEVQGIFGVARDISDRRRTEHDLIRAKEAAEAGDRAKSAFLANMSHEIRTPLNGVLGLTELLLRTTLDPTQREHAQAIQRAGDTLLAIINDILDFSKIEAGRLELEEVPVDLLLQAHDVMDLFRGRAEELDLLVSSNLRAPLRVLADPTRLRQILANLVGNAVKFTASGHVLIRLDGTREGDRAHLRLTVEDTGIGIPPDRLPHLFQPFTQADLATTRRYGGTGLGLAITRRLVELMGGRIEVESLPGRGTVFTLDLSFPADVSTSSVLEPAVMRGRRVLVVEQMPLTRKVLAEQLTALGCEPVEAADAQTGRQILAQGGEPVIAAVVFGRPGEGTQNRQATAWFLEQGETPVIRLVAASAAGSMPSAPGTGLVLAKPIRPEAFARALRKALRAASTSASTSTQSSSGRPSIAPGAMPGVRILLVEDNAVNRQVAMGMLQLLAVDARVAENGKEALAQLAVGSVDAILMDCQMPEMDGFQATAAIRERERSSGGRRLPIIALTANALAGDRERCLAAGMDDYLAKPVTIEALRSAIERWTRPVGDGSGRRSPIVARHPTPAGGMARMSLGQVLNPERLAPLRAALKADDEQLRQTLLLPFLHDAKRYTDACAQAVAAKDPDALVRPAHTLKGSALTVGAEALGNAAARLVALGRSKDLASLAAAQAALEQELKRLGDLLGG